MSEPLQPQRPQPPAAPQGNGADPFRLRPQDALWMLHRMQLIRQLSNRVAELYPSDVMETPVHLCTGQEAVPVGVCRHLTDEDKLFMGHRTHGPALAKGMPVRKLVAELYGRTTGCSHAMGGSMHLLDLEHGLPGSSAIVGGSIALGVGAGLASLMTSRGFVGVSWFGDAATNAGVFHESMNFAALRELPVLFVCEDNGLSNVMPKRAHAAYDIPDLAWRYMDVFEADGTDVLSVYEQAGRALDFVRRGGGPAFLHCPTKRWMKHQGHERCDLNGDSIVEARDCPIHKLEEFVRRTGMASGGELEQMRTAVAAEIQDAIAFAEASPFPDPTTFAQEC